MGISYGDQSSFIIYSIIIICRFTLKGNADAAAAMRQNHPFSIFKHQKKNVKFVHRHIQLILFFSQCTILVKLPMLFSEVKGREHADNHIFNTTYQKGPDSAEFLATHEKIVSY